MKVRVSCENLANNVLVVRDVLVYHEELTTKSTKYTKVLDFF